MVEVLVVTTALEIGQVIAERNAAWQKWPKANLNAKYITRDANPDAIRNLTGAAARQPLFAGEPVTNAKLVKREGASILAIVLRDGYRAPHEVGRGAGLGRSCQTGEQGGRPVDAPRHHSGRFRAGASATSAKSSPMPFRCWRSGRN